MEEAFRAGGFLEKQLTAKPPIQYSKDLVKKDDVELLVRRARFFAPSWPSISTLMRPRQIHEFEISKAQAEKTLAENGGDVTKALEALMK